MTQPPDQPRRGRKPLPKGQAKTRRNIRVGSIWEQAESLLRPKETITHFVEEAMEREIAKRRRELKKAPPPS